MENKNYGLQTMFDEAQKQLEREFKSSATLRNHATTVISVSSVIVSFFATFKVFDIASVNLSNTLLLLFILIGLFYTALMIVAIRAAHPFSLTSPINPDAEEYIEAYADKSYEDILTNQTALYLAAIQKNRIIISDQYGYSKAVDYLLGVVVALIVLATIIAVL